MLCLLLGRICLQTSNVERPLHKQISESICTSFREEYCRPNPVFKHHKAAASIKSSPSRTNTNLNTLQCSFPKPPSIQPLCRPFPRTHPSPQICSATIEKALGLQRWPLQGYDRWSGARSARFTAWCFDRNIQILRVFPVFGPVSSAIYTSYLRIEGSRKGFSFDIGRFAPLLCRVLSSSKLKI